MISLNTLGYLALFGLAVIIVISVQQYRAQIGQYRPLSQRQPSVRRQDDKGPLGTEAIDMGLVNRVNRRNEALERAHVNWTKRDKHFLGASDTHIEPWKDDETYAARYHAAFQTKTDQTKDKSNE